MARVQTPLVGRARELQTITDALTFASNGRGGVVLVEGESGIGKSRLVKEAVDVAARRGFHVRATACTEPERTVPFGAAVRLFGPAGAASNASMDVDPGDALTPALQFRVSETLGNAVEALAESGPVVIVLDDLQWADSSTLLAMRSIAARLERLPVLLVGAVRSGHQVGDLHRWADDLGRAGASLISLRPLDDESVAALVASVVGNQPTNDLLERVRRAGGNPLYVTEYARVAAEDGDRLPVEFRLTVQRRLGHLPREVSDAIRMASVLGSTFDPAGLAVALGCSTVDVAGRVEQALLAGVIEERDGTLAFKHDLVRQAVYDHIAPTMRRALHKEVGSQLAAAGAGPLVVAHHLSLGADGVDTDAAEWLHRAAREALHRAPAVAAELLERARDLLGISAPARVDVLVDLVMAYAWSGRLNDAQSLAAEVLARAIDEATAISLRAALVRALIWQGSAAEAVRQAGLGDDEQTEVAGTDMLAAETALARFFVFDYHGAGLMAARAEAAATASGNALALCQALSVQVWVATFTGRPYEAVELGRRAVAIADASPGGSAHLAHPRFFPGMPLVMLDRLDEAERLMREGRRYAEERGLVWSLPLYSAYLSGKLFAAGDWDAAVAECEAGLALSEQLGLALPQALVTTAWLAAIQVHRDELEAADATIARAQRRFPGARNILLNWAIALLHEARGELDAALARLQGAWEVLIVGGAAADPFSPMALVRLCVRTGDIDRAVALLPAVARQASVVDTPFMRGQALRCEGLVTHDPDLLLDAVVEYRESPRPAELAAGCEDAGAALLRHSRTTEGVAFLDEALQRYEGLGAHWDIARVRATLREFGIRRAGRRRRTAAESGWESLTDTELKVVELVALRLSNPEVAERLFISRHTVESHLKRIYRKLDLSSRVELAAAASQRQ